MFKKVITLALSLGMNRDDIALAFTSKFRRPGKIKQMVATDTRFEGIRAMAGWVIVGPAGDKYGHLGMVVRKGTDKMIVWVDEYRLEDIG